MSTRLTAQIPLSLVRAAAALAALLLVACTGSANVDKNTDERKDSGAPTQNEAGTGADGQAGDGATATGDLSLSDGQGGGGGDGVVPTHDGSSSTVGSPCPCTGDLVCSQGACRAKCTRSSDPCKAASTCPAGERCVPYSPGNFNVCLPGVAVGGSCNGSDAFCADNSRCGYTGTDPLRCLPICSKVGDPCGSGGTCTDFSSVEPGCFLCSKP